jgi:8-oxo-dGTP pyrophosphatase MutT (NUDIX family)
MAMHDISSREDAAEAIWRPDVTVATIVARDGRFLMVEERVRGELVLNQPAGHLEPDESLLRAAERETREETGWTIEISHLVGIYQWSSASDVHFLRFTFAARALHLDERQALDAGIIRAVWMTRDQIASGSVRLRSPMVLMSIDDWLNGQRLPLDALHALDAGSRS